MKQNPPILVSEKDIQRRVSELAEEISRDYGTEQEIVLIGVLKGAFIFLADLSRRLTIPRRIEFMALSSYDRGSVSGAVRLLMDLRESVENRHVLIVEDIVDTGRTLQYLTQLLTARGPASVKRCALVRKKDRHEVDVQIEYLGFDIPDVWVVGYGLDYAERHRSLPYIGTIEPTDG
ncbi:MAG: hypoxanthine phosphoribosyltransferase [Gammaproteobacteria bacterium]|nr:hypoxanthine phosphoribosyltransferase [Gammaproteobacteria bacterium]